MKKVFLGEVAKTSDPGVTQITLLDERFYYIKKAKRYLAGVTWMLESYPKGKYFYKWLAGRTWEEAERIKEAGGERGTNVHHAINSLIDGKAIRYSDYTEEEWRCLIGFRNFWEDYKPEVIAKEKVVYSLKHGYAGTMDFKGRLRVKKYEGLTFVIDWKTSPNDYDTHELQVCAYAQAEVEMGGKVNKTASLRLNGRTNGRGYKLTVFDDYRKAFPDFLAVKKIWGRRYPNASPKIVEVPETIKLSVRGKK